MYFTCFFGVSWSQPPNLTLPPPFFLEEVNYDFLRCVVIWNINELIVNDFSILPASDIIWYFYFPSEWLLLTKIISQLAYVSANDIISVFSRLSHAPWWRCSFSCVRSSVPVQFFHFRSLWSCVLLRSLVHVFFRFRLSRCLFTGVGLWCVNALSFLP